MSNYCYDCGDYLDEFGECENCEPLDYCQWCDGALTEDGKCEWCFKKQE